jgi:hypothetical protein
MRCYCVRFPYAPSQSQLINRGYPVLSKVRISSSFQPKLMMSATLRSIVSPSRTKIFGVRGRRLPLKVVAWGRLCPCFYCERQVSCTHYDRNKA